MTRQRVGRIAERDQRHSVLRLQAFEDAVQCLLRLLHRVALHRSGAVDDDGQRERTRLLQAREERLEARDRRHAFGVLSAQDEAARRLRRLHVQDEVAVHDGLRLQQGQHSLLRRLDQLDGMGRADELRVAQSAEHLHAQGELALDRERGFRDLVRPMRRFTEARRDRGRQEEAQPIAGPPVQDRVAEGDLRRLLRKQIADIHRVEARLDGLQHHGRVAGLDGILVLLLGRLLPDDDALEHAPADGDFEIEQHRVER
ncbi:MAG: hypothetical protein NFCOHLIN_03159 [Gammaproteobacteria bacterium]|nr:hypothetical protein [Gammaproteobacteria bacterium]